LIYVTPGKLVRIITNISAFQSHVIGREVELGTYDGQHANTVLSALMLCVEAVVYPFGHARGPRFHSVEAAKSD
jgi:hypothetical protein